MMDHLASAFIDNELTLGEKRRFVDRIHTDPPFYHQTRDLLIQESWLRVPPDHGMPADRLPAGITLRSWFRELFRPLLWAAAGFAAAGVLLFHLVPGHLPPACWNRFLLYEPTAQHVDIAGSFTGWHPRPMTPLGDTGYWELRLRVPAGEHRFAYILDGSRKIADPTLAARERDDYGGENSILTMEEEG